MSRIYARVSRVAAWPGWCSPCEREDRPLVLTRSGPGGVRSWLAGLNDDDRLLLLTCRICGQWQHVPAREEDDPEVVLTAEALTAEAAPVLDVPAPVAVPAAVEVPAVRVPSPRPPVPRIVTVPEAVTPAAFPPEVVEAAARVLAAARAQTQRTVAPRPAPLDRSRRSAGGAAPRRSARPVAPRSAELPTAVGVPAGTHSVVLAAAS